VDPKKLAPFSSYGPAKFGRIRPDVVAPGTWVVSAKTQGEHVTWSDDVQSTSGWQADPAYTLTTMDAFAGTQSWHLQRAAGTTFQDFLISPPISAPAGPDLFVEVWLRGTIVPANSFVIATQPGNGNPEQLEGNSLLGARTFNHWTVVTGPIKAKFLGMGNLRLLFVAMQDTPSSGPIDLFIDRIRITTFESWGALSADTSLAAPLDIVDRSYTFMGGTSMATPLVAGAAAVVRESLIKGGTPQPSAALVKGVLINTATPHSGIRPNFKAGWGLVNVHRALQSTYLLDDASALKNGETMTYKVKVTGSSELRAPLVWTDPPFEQLVNNLDLTMVSPTGAEIQAEDPNGTAPDNINNVEGIDVGAPELGEWTIKVKAAAVKQGTTVGTAQPFAMIVSGPIDTSSP
jgi:subtilisin family serine protease